MYSNWMTAATTQHCCCLPHTGLSWCCRPDLHCSQRPPASVWRTAPCAPTCTGCMNRSGASSESLSPPGYHLCWLSASPEYINKLLRDISHLRKKKKSLIIKEVHTKNCWVKNHPDCNSTPENIWTEPTLGGFIYMACEELQYNCNMPTQKSTWKL